LIPDYADNKEAALTARSAVRWPEKINKKTPLLLLHGSADWRVHPTEALAMVSALYKSKQPFRFVFFEGGDHGLSEYQGEVNRQIKDWLDHYVRDREPWPSLEPHGD
jgi:dipeptidyl aminopeptidase/acylaminoacyl peptidase